MTVKATPKKLKIVLGINSLVSTKHIAYSNHIQFLFRLGRNYPHDIILNNPARMSIDRFRNMTAQVALESEADYVLFLDDDVLIPFNSLDGLLAANADITAADVCIRGYPFDHMLFRYGKGKKKAGLYAMKSLPSPRGVIDVDAVGCSLTLIRTDVFKQMAQPYFVTGPTTNTEDIYFCLKAKEANSKCTIRANTSIVCQHILWEETIGSDNKQLFKKYQEQQLGIGKKDDEGNWRGTKYLNAVKELVKK